MTIKQLLFRLGRRMIMSLDWQFSGSANGNIQGINNASIELFSKNNAFEPVIKEVIQNSLDAQKDKGKPVEVSFDYKEVPTVSIPGYQSLLNILEDAEEFWKDKKNDDTYKRIIEYKKKLKDSGKISILIISDENTTGLSDPFNTNVMKGEWNALIRMNGSGTKTENQNGSKGLGKAAPFSVSDFRMVFYRTLNTRYESAAEGVFRFISFNLNNRARKQFWSKSFSSSENCITDGTGYYCNDNRTPVPHISWLDKMKDRNKTGTDLFIVGISQKKTKWEKEILKAVLKNYLFAIYKGNLVVHINNSITIDKQNLKIHVESLATNKDGRQNLSFYRALTAENSRTERFSLDGLNGEVVIHFITEQIDNQEIMAHRYLMTRESGMKLFDKAIKSDAPYCAVVEMSGGELSSYFRTLETATHDQWHIYNSDNSDLAQSRINQIDRKINEIAGSIAVSEMQDQTELDWLGEKDQKTNGRFDWNKPNPKSSADKSFNGDLLSRMTKSKTKVRLRPASNYGNGEISNSGGQINKAQPETKNTEGSKREKGISNTGKSDFSGKDKVTSHDELNVLDSTLKVRSIILKDGTIRINVTLPDKYSEDAIHKS